MQATNGFAVLSRSRIRLIGCSMAIALALSALCLASTASAAKPARKAYLAIGDSLAFGYSQQLFNENEATGENPEAFEHGYVDDYLNTLGNGVPLFNDGCPGETSDSMIGNGPLGTVMAEKLGTTDEAPCAYHYVDGLPLHNEYGENHSQLENALEVIKKQSTKTHAVETISFNIGANDELHQLHKCEAEVKHEFETEGKSKYGKTPEEAGKNCILSHIPSLFKHILTNIAGALYVIRQGSSFCVPAAASCSESKKGVNYTGKIVVQGGYTPFGAVFTPGVELLPGSNALAGLLNFQEAKTVAEFGACYANPQPRFNPAIVGEPAAEPGRLQAFTNMANFTEFAGKKNGPDIHPTPLGYQELANIMHADCG
jgi:lysophospholipase L1-like esterase